MDIIRHILLLIIVIIFSLTTATGDTDKVKSLLREKKYAESIALVDNSKNIEDSKKGELSVGIVKLLLRKKKYDQSIELTKSTKYMDDEDKKRMISKIESAK